MLAYFGRYLLMLKVVISNSNFQRLRGATVARLTPDQKVACSNHVGVKFIFPFSVFFISLVLSQPPNILRRRQDSNLCGETPIDF